MREKTHMHAKILMYLFGSIVFLIMMGIFILGILKRSCNIRLTENHVHGDFKFLMHR